MGKRFTKIGWDHTAICHQGMNEHANVSRIEKSNDPQWVRKETIGVPVFKYDLIKVASSEAQGHRHGIRVEIRDGELMLWCMYATKPGDDSGHDHMVMLNEDGDFELITNNGHKHKVSGDDIAAEINSQLFKSFECNGKSLSTLYSEYLGKAKDKRNKGDNPMTNPTEDVNKDGENFVVSKAQYDEMQAKIDKLAKIQSLSKDASAHYMSLSTEEERDAFLAKSDDDRAADIKVAKDREAKSGTDEEVLYKSLDGTVVKKGDPGSTATAEALRKADELTKQLEDKDLTEVIEKEFSHMPGESDVKKRLVSIVRKHGGDHTEDIMKILKSKDETFAKSSKPQSSPVQKNLDDDSESDPDAIAKDQEARVNKLMAENPSLSKGDALTMVIKNEDQAD